MALSVSGGFEGCDADAAHGVDEAVITTYRAMRQPGERFIHTVGRIGIAPFKAAADAERHLTAAR